MTDRYTATELAYKNGQAAAEKTLSELRRENIQLRAENEKLKAERDAAIDDITPFCANCKHHKLSVREEPCNSCGHVGTSKKSKWEWRGVQHDEP